MALISIFMSSQAVIPGMLDSRYTLTLQTGGILDKTSKHWVLGGGARGKVKDGNNLGLILKYEHTECQELLL